MKRSDSGVISRAVRHLTTAGERELMLSGYKEASAHLEQALELLMTLPPGRQRDELELTVRTRTSTVRKATVGPAAEQVRIELVRCQELCEELGDRPELGSVLYSFWQLHLFRAQYPESLRYAQLCLAEAERSGNLDILIQSYVALSNTYFWFCDLKEAEESYKQVLAHYDPARHGHHALHFGMDPGVLALMFGTWVPQITGRFAEAAERHAEVVRLKDTLPHALSIALALNTTCCYHVNRGDSEGARRAGQAMIDLARLHGLFVYEIIGIHFRGWGAAKSGDVDKVIDEVRSTYANYVKHVGGLAQTYIAMLAAGVFEEAGELDEALETLERALEVAESEQCRELAYHAELMRLRGDLLARVGRADEAVPALHRALELAVERGQPPFALRAALGIHRIADRQGEDLSAARDLVRTQLARFGPDERDGELDRARAMLG
jgi:tetratricopeptide (TPR) repeat protein